MNTASEYGFGAVALAGFPVLPRTRGHSQSATNEAMNWHRTTDEYRHGINRDPVTTAPILFEVHRVAAMASGGMDTLPHNGAVITLLAITGSEPSPPTAAFSPSR